MRRNVERIKRIRAMTEKTLRPMGFEVPPSQANFVLARLQGHDMGSVAAGLRRRGILVRHFPQSVFRDALRISIGTPAQMDALFRALEPLIRPMLAAGGNGARGESKRTHHARTIRSTGATVRSRTERVFAPAHAGPVKQRR
jgi:hypothetical protein